MKNNTLRTLVTALLLMISISVCAIEFDVDGIYYNVTSETDLTVEVIAGGYTGDIVIPESVTCDDITYQVTSIGDQAFLACRNLTSVVIPEGVLEIGSKAFQFCNKLTTVSIPNSVITIGASAFYSCTSLTSITIPQSVTSIGEKSFYNCKSLVTITVEEGNKVYDSRDNCNALIETDSNTLLLGCSNSVIPEGITFISDNAFYSNSNLTSITLPQSLVSIGVASFMGCRGLTSLVIPANVTTIGNQAFQNCTGLITITCNAETPPTVYVYTFSNVDTNIPVYVPDGCVQAYQEDSYWSEFTNIVAPVSNFEVGDIYYNVVNDNDVEIISGDAQYIGDIVIPVSVVYENVTYNVVSISSTAFSGCSGITSITCEATEPIAVDGATFTDIDKNIPVYVPEGCAEVYQTTSYWSEFTNIVALVSNFEVDGIYYNVVNDNEVEVISGSTQYTGDIEIPSSVVYNNVRYSVVSINATAFTNCTGLTTINIPMGVTAIEEFTFAGCTGLTAVSIPESVATIGESAFNGCTSLASAVIPNGVTSIGNSAFNGCSGLTAMTISSSVTQIGSYAFKGCTGLLSIKVEDGNTVYDSRNECNAIINTITNTLELGCQNTTIPEDVAYIGAESFYNCTGLTTIIIPSTISSIGDRAFYGCSGLTEMYCKAYNPPYIGADVFNGVDKSIPLYLLRIGVDNYRNYGGWNEFTNMIAHYEIAPVGAIIEVNNIKYEVTEADSEVKLISGSATDLMVDVVEYNGINLAVTAIGDFAFKNCETITSFLMFSDRLKSIGKGAFSGCSNLGSIWLDLFENAECGVMIGDSAFNNCTSLNDIGIPVGVDSIGKYAFNGCSAALFVNLPSTLTSIDDYAFAGCSGVIEIRCQADIPPVIQENTFAGVDKNTQLYVPIQSIEAYKEAEFWSEFTNVLPIIVYGTQFEVDGIRYETVNDTEVQVIYNDSVPYAGVINIPDSVNFYSAKLAVSGIYSEAFLNCTELTSVSIPETVKSLNYNAFKGCTGLTSVIIPNSVSWIDGAVFEDCTGLETVVLPNSIISIVSGVFKGCTSLNTITIPETVTRIGSAAFQNCTGLTSIVIPQNVVTIEDMAFSGCTGLTEIYSNPATPPTLYSETFFGVDKSIPVYVGSGCLQAYQSAWYWNEFTNFVEQSGFVAEGVRFEHNGLYYISLGEGNLAVTYKDGWEDYAGDIVIPAQVVYNDNTYNVTTIGYRAFAECKDLTSLVIPASITKIEEYAFLGRTGLTSIIIEEGNPVYDSRDNCNAIIITDGDKLYYGCKNTVIPGTVKEILALAFLSCIELKEINLPEGLTHIMDAAFYGCSGLTSITIPESMTYLGWYAFEGCTGIKSITIPKNVSYISAECFNSGVLTSITVAEDNTVYDSRENCNAIIETATNKLVMGCRNSIIPNGVQSIGVSAFVHCDGLTEIIIPDGVTLIDDRAFEYCVDLANITIPSSIEYIGNSAFYYCTNLTTVTMPSSVANIGKWAFLGCNKLTTFIMEDDNADVANAPQRVAGNGIAPQRVGGNGVALGNQLLGGCTSLTNVVLSKRVTHMGDSIFYNCSNLTTIEIPQDVTSMGYDMFVGCDALQSIECMPTTPPTISEGTFNGVNLSMPVYVPFRKGDVYALAENWCNLENIIQPAELTICNSYYNTITLAEVYGTSQKMKFTPNNPATHQLSRVLLNGIDVTADVVDGVYTTPTLYENSVIEVLYQKLDGMAPQQATVCRAVAENEDEVQLIIANSDYNTVTLYEKPGTTKQFVVASANDTKYEFNSVSIDDEVLTSDVDGIYTTPALTRDMTLTTQFNIATSESELRSGEVNIYTHNGCLYVVGCCIGNAVTIYAVDGTLLCSKVATDSNMSIVMPRGVYIVRVDGVTRKVVL